MPNIAKIWEQPRLSTDESIAADLVTGVGGIFHPTFYDTMNSNSLAPSPTLAGFAAWLSASADSLTEAAAKAATAGDPARGRQIYSLAQFLRPIGTACQAFAAGQVPELDLVGPPAQPAKTARENAVDFLARFQRELDELNAGYAALEAELQAMGRRVSTHGEAKLAVIERLAAEMKLISAGLAD